MKQEDFKLIAMQIKENLEEGYCCWIACLPAIIVQVKEIQDAPKALAKSFEAFIKYGLKIENFEIVKL